MGLWEKVDRIAIIAILMYGSETWAMKTQERNWRSQKCECAVKKFDRSNDK